MKLLCFDTETQGLPLWSQPSEHPGQPHIVELAAILADSETREELDSYSAIVQPDGWKISDEVAALHGITTERALAEGEPENEVVDRFLAMAAKADLLVAFGIAFDMRILRIALLRSGMTKPDCDAWASVHRQFCVMKACTPICKLPATAKMAATGRNGFKSPKLAEAAKVILGETLDGAHAAMVDVRATLRICYAISKKKAAES